MRFTLFTLLTLFLLGSCSGFSGKRHEVVVDSLYALEMPVEMARANDLHDYASLQYSNEENQFFVMGVHEAKEDLALSYSLEDYMHKSLNYLRANMDTVQLDTPRLVAFNNLQCFSVDLFGAVDGGEGGLEFFYQATICESEDYFYQLYCWTARERQQQLLEEFRLIAQSLHELRDSAAAEVVGGEVVVE